MKFIRDTRTGDYYSQDKSYKIEKGCEGWNIYKLASNGLWYDYISSTQTLKEAKAL